MNADRRTFLAAAAASTVTCCPNIGRSKGRRVSQDELMWAIKEHETWFLNEGKGKRANFAGCDLSGLRFSEGGALSNLRASDFTGANLVGIAADNISFSRASLHGADLSWSHLRKPAFIYSSLRSAVCEGAVWGYENVDKEPATRTEPLDGAAFQHTDAGGRAVFSKTAIRGRFWDTNFNSANLKHADLSYSSFFGLGLACENSFFNADLTGTKFVSAEITSARFSRATLTGADFTNAVIDPRVKFPDFHDVIGHLSNGVTRHA